MDHGASGYMAHGFCYLWEPGLILLHVISDIVTAVAYYSIPIALFYFIYKRRDMVFLTVFILFGLFIFACGTTHLLSAFTVYVPAYWLEGVVKAITAFVSIITVFYLIPLIPQAISMPSLSKALEETKELNRSLEKEMRERKKAVDKLIESEAMLIQQSKMASMGEMIGIISHQWKQPLNAVTLNVQDIKDAYVHGELDDIYIDDVVGSTMQQIEFMAKTIDDFRNFFIPSKKKTKFDVKSAIEELLSMFIHIYNRHNVVVSISAEQDALLLTDGYPNEFKQVVLNILNNAKEAVVSKKKMDNSIKGHIEVNIKNSEDNSKIIILVKDNGGGIPDDVIGKIFEPYFTTKEHEGTGIGLYMSKTIIETNMGGSLTVHNVNEGAEFEIVLNTLDGTT
ncbi:sensor histidine kinase [Candidatus Magnetomonas plexicatena]|uniref:sensor histidine kinase n=1 Tax=Candidatus Magnetomonas plexicatena TaxID=2552947 RepID=UPI001C769AC9|nr:HAMP domain-containing histidine kinase [Nitrospirales bacterium LBB_01]